jgi:group I intron endonuclease
MYPLFFIFFNILFCILLVNHYLCKNKLNMGAIYKITSPSNKVYVGKTYDVRKRINSHKCEARRGKNTLLHNSIRKYDWENHHFEIIESIDDSLLDEREIFWISELKTYCQENPMGLNMTKGGDGQRNSWMHDTERREQQSKSFSNEGNPFYGKTHSEETKAIIKEKAKERQKIKKNNIPQWGAEKGRLKVIKPCIAYNNKGEFIGEYESLTDCANALDIKIKTVSDCLAYGSWIDGRFMVRFKLDDNYPRQIEVGEIRVKNVKRPVIYVKQDGSRVEYPSAQEASEELGVPKTTINRAAQYNNGRAIRSGHIFLYK